MENKNNKTIVIVSLVIFVVAACSVAFFVWYYYFYGWETYTDAKYGFKIKYHDDLTVRVYDSDPNFYYVYFGSAELAAQDTMSEKGLHVGVSSVPTIGYNGLDRDAKMGNGLDARLMIIGNGQGGTIEAYTTQYEGKYYKIQINYNDDDQVVKKRYFSRMVKSFRLKK